MKHVCGVVSCVKCKQVTHNLYVYPGGCGIIVDNGTWKRGCNYEQLSIDEKDSIDYIIDYANNHRGGQK